MATWFWLSVLGVTYSYFLYPLVLLALPRRRTAPAPAGAPPPLSVNVSVIVAVHNEERRIAEKLEETLATDYPGDLLEVIVASDASTDGTDAIVQKFADRGVRLVRAEARGGKERAQLLAVQEACGEVLVFTDAATRCPPESFRAMARRFDDPRVGAVSSEDRVLGPDGRLAGEGAYQRYEMWLRRLESRGVGLVGLTGAFFAVRRTLCDHWDPRVPSDFGAALSSARHGYVAVSEPAALAVYPDIGDETREYRRKVRTVVRGLATLRYHPEVLNPLRFGRFAFQVISHKVCRWLVPWFAVSLLIASVAYAGTSRLAALALGAQGVLYATALLAWGSAGLRRHALFRIPYYFTQANAAVAHATLAFLAGRRITVWDPTRR